MDNVCEYVSINQEIRKKNELSFPFSDYGFLFGYGLFESIKIINGWPVLIREHLSRIRRGSIILDIPFVADQDQLVESALELIRKNNISDAVLNIYLTAGDRSNNTLVIEETDPLLLMVIRDVNLEALNVPVSISVQQESFQRTPLDRVKTMSWMKNVLERKLHPEADDVLVFNFDEDILETCTANVFFVKGRCLITPDSSVILPGITRQFLLNHQDEMGFEVVKANIKREDLDDLDEIFLTNSLRGVIRVKKVLGYDHLKSGDVTTEIVERYNQLISERVNQNISLTADH